jgi:hypothetical protein
MKRREFITLVGGAAAAWPLATRAQQPQRMRRIGVFMPGTADDPEYQARNAAFLQGLGELGWIVGRNVRIDYRWGAGDVDRYRARSGAAICALMSTRTLVSPRLPQKKCTDCARMFRQSSSAVSTSRAGHRSLRSARAGQHRRWGRGLRIPRCSPGGRPCPM